ncbi:unnamed protein product [Cuscuta campestris]|uniref:PPM-type phosphatase domain-containing protein n=1 Tax=Cuscuta campestris TaxID=132261 RepID=A0A484MUS3_9ASTE|nr:unnamed protein product [Cuscuta campestris]
MGSCFSCSESRSPLPSPNSPCGRKRKSFEKRCPSSFDCRKEEQLHRIRGRRFLNGSSEVASLFTQQGKKGANQDAMLVWENFGSRADTVFCGVFDGHGPYGHMVAKRVRDSLPLKLSAIWEVSTKNDDVLVEISQNTTESMNSDIEEVSMASIDVEQVHKNGDAIQTLKKSILMAFKAMDRELRTTSIDCFCSGTTTVALVKQGQDLVIGNVGDSRAILGTRDKDNFLTAVQLTVDLKPNLPAEAERIRKCKGRIFALRDEPGIARVWLPNTYSPGLAMSRAFGDFCLKDFGLISVPKISHRRLTQKDEFIILATDGIWDVLSNEEAVEIVGSAPTRSSAARVLVEAAVRSWRTKYPTSRVDDCAVVCLFLDDSPTKGAYSASSNDKAVPLAPSRVHNHENGGEKWPSTRGVSRVDTLLTLPRVGSA